MNTALVLVDIQNDYFEGGKMALDGSRAAGSQAARVLTLFRRKGWPVSHIRHESVYPGAKFFLPGTGGAEIHHSVSPLAEGETVITKYFANSFRDTPLLDQLRRRDIEQLVICGMMTNMCVDATVRAAYDFGFKCMVVHDACAAARLEFEGRRVGPENVHSAFLAALAMVYARVLDADEAISELTQSD